MIWCKKEDINGLRRGAFKQADKSSQCGLPVVAMNVLRIGSVPGSVPSRHEPRGTPHGVFALPINAEWLTATVQLVHGFRVYHLD